MKSFQQYITETFANKIGTSSKMPADTTVDNPGIKRQFQGAKKYQSTSRQHIVYHVKDKNGNNHYAWVHRRTGDIDGYMKTKEQAGKLPNERFHHDILIQSRDGGPSIGAHMFHDLWSGKFGHYGISVHDNQSPGAIRLHKKLRKHFGDKVLYHTYNPKTGEAKHLTHGVAASGDTPDSLFNAIHSVNIVAMMKPKYRPRLSG